MEWCWREIAAFIAEIGNYIKTNSIEFISIVASILVAIETNKWIEKNKEKKEMIHLINDLVSEIEIITNRLKNDRDNAKGNLEEDKLTLRLIPYNFPVWNSIKNTNKINLLTEKRGYIKILEFYSEISELNEWENTLTYFVLFKLNINTDEAEEDTYKDLLVEQVAVQREKVICLAEEVYKVLKEE